MTAAAKNNGYQYYCIVSDSSGNTEQSETVTLTVLPGPRITGQPSDRVANEGNKVSFHVTAAGNGLSYQWYYKSPNSSSFKKTSSASGLTADYSITAAAKHNGYKYYCVVTDAEGYTDKSQTVTLTVNISTVIIQQPKNVTASMGEDAVFNVKATGDNISYQWQVQNADGVDWVGCEETYANGKILLVEVTDGMNGSRYRCAVSNAGGTVFTNVVTLTVS